MQRKMLLVMVLMLAVCFAVKAQEYVIESVVISPDSVTIEIGQTKQFTVTVTDTIGAPVDTTVVWSTDGTTGTIDANGLFTASSAGTGSVIATVGDIADTAMIAVSEPVQEEPQVDSVKIFPHSHCITLEDSVQFTVEVKDAEGEYLDTTVSWTVSDELVGSIDENGLFQPLALGEVDVIASVGAVADTARVTVNEEVTIQPGTNIVNVLRVKPDGKTTKFGSYTLEGDTLNIGGIPSPLNFMNGTKIVFPPNSLDEDITLTFKIPECGRVYGNEVDFGDTLVTAVTFEVSVDGVPIHPYEFAVPLEVSIPFKRGLLTHRGLEPEDISMFYVSENGDLIEEGITDISVDYENNRITGIVEHFSDIALAPAQSLPTAADESFQSEYILSSSYPNPFNPVTTISYYVPAANHVTLTIYNMVGQRIRELVNDVKTAGYHSVTWDGRTSSGDKATSGVYIYVIEAGQQRHTAKITLMK